MTWSTMFRHAGTTTTMLQAWQSAMSCKGQCSAHRTYLGQDRDDEDGVRAAGVSCLRLGNPSVDVSPCLVDKAHELIR